MADILITNIDFPKGKEALALEVNRHGEVFVFYRDEASGRVAPLKRRESNAIEMPPHGELMDKQAFFESEKGRIVVIGRAGARAIRELYERIAKAPAVVEATDGADS